MMTRRHKRTLFAGSIATLTIAAIAAWFAYSSDAATPPPAPPLPQVVVSTPLAREVDSRLGFLGQFSAIERVELRAQVGGIGQQVLVPTGMVGRAALGGDDVIALTRSSVKQREEMAEVEIQVGTAHLKAKARTASGTERQKLWDDALKF